MPLIDDQGRAFGRFNLIDAAAVVFVLALVPLAYAAYLLFRPAAPRIDSVTRVEITREERRLAGGSVLSAKLKVRGSGFNPMLRASIGDTHALGFVFEDPNAADVLVGRVAPGTHDLVLWDGVQEVARAAGAVTIDAPSSIFVRLAGRLLELDPAVAQALQASDASASKADVTFAALGPIESGHLRLRFGDRSTDVPLDGRVERAAVVQVRCDPQTGQEPCTIGGQTLTEAPVVVTIPTPQGALKLAVEDVLPATPPQSAVARVRLVGGPELAAVRVGDRDASLSDSAAVVTAVSHRPAAGGAHEVQVSLRLGVDSSRDGWRYRGRLVTPGAPLTLSTAGYVASGTVEQLTVEETGAR